MAQPDYVPVGPADRVRQTERLPPARPWTVSRPGEIAGLRPPRGESFGAPGPDQGYALLLARRFRDRLVVQPGENADDAIAGCLGVALKRASLFGRAPVVYDLEHAFALFGFLGGAPESLVDFRRQLFQAVAHHYWDQREIADVVQEETLRMTPGEVRQRLGEWRTLIRAEDSSVVVEEDIG